MAGATHRTLVSANWTKIGAAGGREAMALIDATGNVEVAVAEGEQPRPGLAAGHKLFGQMSLPVKGAEIVWARGAGVYVCLTMLKRMGDAEIDDSKEAMQAARVADAKATAVGEDIEAMGGNILPLSSYAAALGAPKPAAQQRISAVINGQLVEWVRVAGGPCLGGGWMPVADVTPQHFGGTGTGVAVEKDAVQAALDLGQASGRAVVLTGVHRIDGELVVQSGARIVGPGVLEQCTLRVEGSTGVETTLTSATYAGASALPVTDASGFAVGDYIRIVSTTNAQGPSAGDFILGDRRNADPAVWLSEFARIYSITGNTLNLDTRLVFPYSVTPDADSAGRVSASVIKVDFLDNIHVQDVTLRRNSTNVLHYPLVAKFLGPDVRFERCSFDCSQSSYVYARPFYIALSYGVKFRECDFKGITLETLAGSQGNCEVRSCQDIWFDGCNANGGNQGIDVTAGGYAMIGGPSIGVRIERCKFENTFTDAITTHWGCYGTIIRDNLIRSKSGNGIRIRSRNDVVEGNDLQGGPGANGAGIFISNIPFQGMRVRGNRVSGYRNQIHVSVLFEADYTIDDWPAGQLGLTISDNDLLSYAGGAGGIRIEAAASPSAKPLNITLRDNTIRAIGASGSQSGIFLSSYANGVTIIGNEISGLAAGVYINKNSAWGIVSRNIMRDCTVASIRGQTSSGSQIEDTNTFGSLANAGYVIEGNYYVRSPGMGSIPSGMTG